MNNLFLKPRCDTDGAPMLVRDPDGWKPLAVAGEWKPETPYWLCRVRDADVIDATADKLLADLAEPDAAMPAKAKLPEPKLK